MLHLDLNETTGVEIITRTGNGELRHNKILTILAGYLPRDASAERGDATVSRLSVCLSVRPSVRDVQVSGTHRLEFFKNNFTAE